MYLGDVPENLFRYRSGPTACDRARTGLERVCLGPAGSVRVLDFVQERCHDTGPGVCEAMFIEAGDSEAKKD